MADKFGDLRSWLARGAYGDAGHLVALRGDEVLRDYHNDHMRRVEAPETVHVFEPLVGEVFTSVRRGKRYDADVLLFEQRHARTYAFLHLADCCECVFIEDVCGDLDDLADVPLMRAEEFTRTGGDEDGGTYTYSFYTFATHKGTVTVRWFGSSNGYYSEAVSLGVIDEDGVFEEIDSPWRR